MCIVTLEFNQSNALARRKLAALLATGLFVEKDFKPEAPRTGASPSRSPVSSSVKSLLAISSATYSVALGSIKQQYFNEIVDKIVESIF